MTDPTNPDTYTVFVNLLEIILAMLAVIVGGGLFGMYQILSHKIQKEAESKAHFEIQKQVAGLFLEMGFVYWTDYEMQGKKHGLYLDKAFHMTDLALGIAQELDEKKNEKLLCVIKNNYAYFLSEKPTKEKGDKQLAMEYSQYCYDRITKYSQYKSDWTDTYEHVRKQFP